jgi:hypothetical protein
MIPKPDHIRVMERPRPRTREENPSPSGGTELTQPKSDNLPQGGQVGRWVGKSQTWTNVDTRGHTGTSITWSAGEFAERIGVSVKTLQRWDRTGVLPARRYPTGRRFYTPAELAMALDTDSR